MPNVSSWLGGARRWGRRTAANRRAAISGMQVEDELTQIQLYRPGINGAAGTLMAAQPMRIEPGVGGGFVDIQLGMFGSDSVMVYGFRDHDVYTDTDIKAGDRFDFADNGTTRTYMIESVDDVPGQVVARGRISQS